MNIQAILCPLHHILTLCIHITTHSCPCILVITHLHTFSSTHPQAQPSSNINIFTHTITSSYRHINISITSSHQYVHHTTQRVLRRVRVRVCVSAQHGVHFRDFAICISTHVLLTITLRLLKYNVKYIMGLSSSFSYFLSTDIATAITEVTNALLLLLF